MQAISGPELYGIFVRQQRQYLLTANFPNVAPKFRELTFREQNFYDDVAKELTKILTRNDPPPPPETIELIHCQKQNDLLLRWRCGHLTTNKDDCPNGVPCPSYRYWIQLGEPD